MSVVEVLGRIDAPVETVWGYLGNFLGVKRWNPFVHELETQGDGGPGSVRIVTHASGARLVETLQAIDPEARSLRYDAVMPDGSVSTSAISLQADGDGTLMAWQSTRDGEADEEFRKAHSAILMSRIDALAAHIAAQ